MFAVRLAALAALLLATPAFAKPKDCMNMEPQWWMNSPSQKAIYDKLVGYLSCPSDDPASGVLADKVACNYFVGKVLNDLYVIRDFSTGDGTWLLANRMLDYVKNHPNTWSKLGTADSQSVVNDAAEGAANGQAVIALMRGDPGHVALVLPGEPKASTTWGGLKAPNSAAFSIGHVDNAYVFCRLSNAFTDPKKVEIWWRIKAAN